MKDFLKWKGALDVFFEKDSFLNKKDLSFIEQKPVFLPVSAEKAVKPPSYPLTLWNKGIKENHLQ